MTGKNFRDYHLLLDEHADQIFAMTDPVAERVRKLGGTTLRSIGEISGHQRLKDNNQLHLEFDFGADARAFVFVARQRFRIERNLELLQKPQGYLTVI